MRLHSYPHIHSLPLSLPYHISSPYLCILHNSPQLPDIQKIFDELRTVIESLQFQAEEDSKTKQFEIDKLKKEISLLYRNKEDALEAQRKDLSSTFETILQQREDSFSKYEQEISQQITLLDTKLEKLQNENLKLKELLRDLRGTNEKLVEENHKKDEKQQQTSFQLQEEIQKRLTNDDTMKRHINGLQLDLQKEIDNHMKVKMELETALEKVRPIIILLL